jgi:protein-arginine kinase
MFQNLPSSEEVVAMQNQVKKLKKEIKKFEDSKKLKEESVEKSDSEIESLTEKLFLAFDADETGKSLLKKHLDENLFDYLKSLKTDHKGSLLDNIISGLKHFDSEIGIFASDESAYETFADLFNPVLEDLFDVLTEIDKDGNELPGKQVALNWGDVESIKQLDREELFVKASSITVCRAVEGFPFGPLISFDQLNEVSNVVQKILLAIDEEDLKGEFYELADIDEDQKAKWIEEEILSPNPQDKFKETAGTYRLWPVGRGLFLNDKKNLRVWVNQEEHLQITSFNKEGNLREVYQRLVKVIEKFNSLKFARDQRWGFLAHNLKNIGTTMRISVKVKLPQMLKEENKEKLEILCEGNRLVYEDIGGGKVLLTNKKRVGLSEIETVKAFEKGVEEIIMAEKCAYIA